VSSPETGTESPRAFVPAKDFALSKRFYDALGFTKTLDGDEIAIYKIGVGEFLLQPFYVAEHANNFMMQLMVDDLDAWWKRIEILNLPKRFGVRPPKPPAKQPWGLRVGYIWDPSGVLWHVAQRRKNAPAD